MSRVGGNPLGFVSEQLRCSGIGFGELGSLGGKYEKF